jgi:phosphatidylglycerophosphate synthase
MGSSSDREKDALLSYKYVSPPLSICERLWLDKFWDWTAEQYPRWLAPNVITLIGFAMILTSATLIFCYSPSLEGDAPSWVYLVCAACIFGYQTLDGSDGKQARRTKSGGPLGELCDHGCDALCSILLPLACFDGMGFTWNHPLTIATFVGAQSAFMLSNMVLCHTGRQMFFEFDAMEIELSAIVGLIVSGVFTTAVWKQTSFAVSVPSGALAALGAYGQKLRLTPPAADGSQDLTLYLRDLRYFVVLFMPINLCRYLHKMFSFYLAGKVNEVFSDVRLVLVSLRRRSQSLALRRSFGAAPPLSPYTCACPSRSPSSLPPLRRCTGKRSQTSFSNSSSSSCSTSPWSSPGSQPPRTPCRGRSGRSHGSSRLASHSGNSCFDSSASGLQRVSSRMPPSTCRLYSSSPSALCRSR